MDWNTLFWIGGLVLFVWIMARGCGGMMSGRGGGCGMRRHEPRSASAERDESDRKKTA